MGSRTASPSAQSRCYHWPLSAANWRANCDGLKLQYTNEYPIYSDAWITGEINQGLGPYKFLNALGFHERHEAHVYPAIILRVDWHLTSEEMASTGGTTDAARYHGGELEDELAALLGLCIGVRAKAGASSRRFDPAGDPKGRPFPGTSKMVPRIAFQRVQRLILPWTARQHCMNDAMDTAFRRMPSLTTASAGAVVKAARLHQEALWIAEGAPEMAWLLLVTAVETAADHWRRASISPLSWLEERKPRLCKRFREECQEDPVSYTHLTLPTN